MKELHAETFCSDGCTVLSLKRTHPQAFFEDLKFFILITLNDGWHELWYFSFKVYIRQSCFICFKWFIVFSWKIIVGLCMNTLWKLLIIRTILGEDWVCVKSFWRVEIFIFPINIVYYVCRCNAFVNIWLTLTLNIGPWTEWRS